MEIVAKLQEGNHSQNLYVRNGGKIDCFVATMRGIPEVREFPNSPPRFFITVLSDKSVQEIMGFFHADKIEWEK